MEHNFGHGFNVDGLLALSDDERHARMLQRLIDHHSKTLPAIETKRPTPRHETINRVRHTIQAGKSSEENVSAYAKASYEAKSKAPETVLNAVCLNVSPFILGILDEARWKLENKLRLHRDYSDDESDRKDQMIELKNEAYQRYGIYTYFDVHDPHRFTNTDTTQTEALTKQYPGYTSHLEEGEEFWAADIPMQEMIGCLPYRFSMKGGIPTATEDPDAQAKFFAFLCVKGLVTEAALYAKGLMLGTQQHKVLRYIGEMQRDGVQKIMDQPILDTPPIGHALG